MNHKRRYVDMLGFLGDVGPPMLDDRTLKNARDSGVNDAFALGLFQIPHISDAPFVYGNISRISRFSGTIDNFGVPDQDVVHV
jgi:hypothetical protein